jgi:hypothetical protein
MRRRPTQAMADMMRMPIRLAAVFLSWTLSHSVHARCVGEPVQVEVRVTDAGAPVPGAAIRIAWVAAGARDERCSLLHRPAAAAIPVQIELRGG